MEALHFIDDAAAFGPNDSLIVSGLQHLAEDRVVELNCS